MDDGCSLVRDEARWFNTGQPLSVPKIASVLSDDDKMRLYKAKVRIGIAVMDIFEEELSIVFDLLNSMQSRETQGAYNARSTIYKQAAQFVKSVKQIQKSSDEFASEAIYIIIDPASKASRLIKDNIHIITFIIEGLTELINEMLETKICLVQEYTNHALSKYKIFPSVELEESYVEIDWASKPELSGDIYEID